jgi:2-polyprenyl-6-methoxyphenol hydroxylase-like FAD-dependent oxidoreductase
VVFGGSLAGLAAAASLAERFDEVTIVDADALPLTGHQRSGVPQGRHAHLLIPGGLCALAELLPGIVDELEQHGAHIVDAPEVRFYIAGGRLALSDRSLRICVATRPLLEAVVRLRIRSLPNVNLVDQTVVEGLLTGGDGAGVTGVPVPSPHRHGTSQ